MGNGEPMEAVTLGKLGSVAVVPPSSFAIISDLCSEYNDKASRAKLARLCAAAIGVCWDRSKNDKRPPVYDFTAADPIGYGGAVIDWLHGFDVSISTIFNVGGSLIVQLFERIPLESEVTEAEDFTEAAPVALTG